MATAVSAFTAIANDDRNVQDVQELIISEIKSPEVDDIFTIVPNIKGGQQVAAVGALEYITKADAGCGNGITNDPDIPAIHQTWDPKRQSIKLSWCYSDFEAAFTQWALANGYDSKDISNSTALTEFLVAVVSQGIRLDRRRIALMSYATIGDDDILTNEGARLADYNTITRGLIPTLQYFSTIGALSENFVNVVKNEGANDTANLALDSDYAQTIYDSLVDSDTFSPEIIISSHTLFKNYKDLLRLGTQFPVEAAMNMMQQGSMGLTYDGVPIHDEMMYDKYRKRDFVVASKRDTPHFALATVQGNLQIGVDSADALTDLRLEYVGGSDEKFYIKANYMMDFKVADPYRIKFAV